EWAAYRGGFRMDWDAKEQDTFMLQGDVQSGESDQFYSTPAQAAPFALVEEETIKTRGWHLLGRWGRALPQEARLMVQSYLDYKFRDQRLLEDERISFDLDAEYQLPKMEMHEVIMGTRYRYTNDDLIGGEKVIFWPSSRADNLFSAFVQDKITLKPE